MRDVRLLSNAKGVSAEPGAASDPADHRRPDADTAVTALTPIIGLLMLAGALSVITWRGATPTAGTSRRATPAFVAPATAPPSASKLSVAPEATGFTGIGVRGLTPSDAGDFSSPFADPEPNVDLAPSSAGTYSVPAPGMSGLTGGIPLATASDTTTTLPSVNQPLPTVPTTLPDLGTLPTLPPLTVPTTVPTTLATPPPTVPTVTTTTTITVPSLTTTTTTMVLPPITAPPLP